jgi:hypothetical protein
MNSRGWVDIHVFRLLGSRKEERRSKISARDLKNLLGNLKIDIPFKMTNTKSQS